MNLNNYGMVHGRLADDVKVMNPNKDGSRKIYVKVASQNNFKNKEGVREAQFINLEAFISGDKKNNGPFDYMKKGDLVAFAYEVRTNNYTDKDGKAVYSQILLITDVELRQPKAKVENTNEAGFDLNKISDEPAL